MSPPYSIAYNAFNSALLLAIALQHSLHRLQLSPASCNCFTAQPASPSTQPYFLQLLHSTACIAFNSALLLAIALQHSLHCLQLSPASCNCFTAQPASPSTQPCFLQIALQHRSGRKGIEGPLANELKLDGSPCTGWFLQEDPTGLRALLRARSIAFSRSDMHCA
eukprot:1157076-Pelagomonas_calceolata.AAC.6